MAQKGTEAQVGNFETKRMKRSHLKSTTHLLRTQQARVHTATLKSGDSVRAGQHRPPHPALLRSMTTWCPSPHPLVLFFPISVLPTAAGSCV